MEVNINRKLMETIRREAAEIQEEVVANRRYLHMNPEIGFDTQNT